nr:diaminopimelate decarboxylase [Nitrosomonas nitrosa]
MTRLSPKHIEEVLKQAVNAKLISDQNPWIVFHNLDLYREKLRLIREAFPANSLHTLAIKANPLLELLRIAVEEEFGLEAASFEEVQLALASGCLPGRIFFDSPAKTKTELRQALRLGVSINADSFEELERINQIIESGFSSKVGLRINPEVGSGRISQTSVATINSKFGESLKENKRAIIKSFEHFPWLSGLHFHVGSQGCDLELLVAAAKRIADLLGLISENFGNERVKWINIGGGIPASYRDAAGVIEFRDYVSALKEVEGIFSNRRLLVTEFGRAVQANCGWAVSQVEYIKKKPETVLAVVHYGADYLMRAVYAPQDWAHEFLLCSKDGTLKEGSARQVTIAGPLCFAGDLPGQHVMLPEPNISDLVVARDTGAYTLSLWSRHCNRAIPMVIGYSQDISEFNFDVLHYREKPIDLINQWGNNN